MAQHNVYVTLPDAELGKKDAFFNIYQNGRKKGRITISKGAIEWYPTNAKQPYKIGWTHFDKMIKEYFEK
jgi:hypothetical protein